MDNIIIGLLKYENHPILGIKEYHTYDKFSFDKYIDNYRQIAARTNIVLGNYRKKSRHYALGYELYDELVLIDLITNNKLLIIKRAANERKLIYDPKLILKYITKPKLEKLVERYREREYEIIELNNVTAVYDILQGHSIEEFTKQLNLNLN